MSTATGPALRAALADDIDRLLSAEPDVRADVVDSVHQMRVATRRLRSVLRSYRGLFRRESVDDLRDELRWLGGVLGVARDAEVRADRFTALADEQTTQAKRAGRALAKSERAKYAAAHRDIVEALDDERYARLRDRLIALRTDPPLRRKLARKNASPRFSDVLRDDFRRVRRLVRDEPAPEEAERIEHLHDIRKAAKRLRYSADAAAPVLGGPAKELSSRAKKLQTVLGDHRDAVEAMATIAARSDAAAARGSDTSGYDRLYESESDAARKYLDQYPAAASFVRHKYGRR
ncbi:CHAD domain-containing protein [Nocardia transvalensis]|uniref:CHAD domain-containing protein n=1 Tax=Nocardia transvalensis TaxID=37333 RepID=A0A7W9UMA6_9NOCA|nr:CHAD domain-containing protein [Nocardia transvalensis]MBB5918167.1 CHAD domain-containing protein [Nocardia transvalensis]